MNVIEHFKQAIKLEKEIEKHRRVITAALQNLLEDEDVDFFYQSGGDGWSVVCLGMNNIPLNPEKLSLLLSMTKADAIEYLINCSV